MTNKEWLATLTTEECYEVLHWLFTVYTYGVNNSKEGIIQWLDSTITQWRFLKLAKDWSHNNPVG